MLRQLSTQNTQTSRKLCSESQTRSVSMCCSSTSLGHPVVAEYQRPGCFVLCLAVANLRESLIFCDKSN